ncbi:MAG: KedN5 family methylcobalamin-dependent radical SAM C-methyltransferase [Solirubrobacterales bacterium]
MSSSISPRLRVALVQQGYWRMDLESLPLASGYLKAAAMADPRLSDSVDIEIYSFDGSRTALEMANELLVDDPPDVLAFSVVAWNYHSFGAVAETYRQMRPDGWVIWGGNHVAHQGSRAFRLYPPVDVVVDGEGEFVFADLLAARLAGESPRELDAIDGITFRRENGEVVETASRERIQDIEEIPSPFLTGAIPLAAADGSFRYEAALMETNRGCPYHCAFCYWGGAVGQKVRRFSRERLREEAEMIGSMKVETLALCDANFGMLPNDVDFVTDLIDVKRRYGYPKAIESSWAKNKSEVFYEVVERLYEGGLRTTFTFSLQSLDEEVLQHAGRRNMPINRWEELASWLDEKGVKCNAELIWGLPGETPDSFLAGYDELASRVSQISVYPLMLMPNTDYWNRREEFGFVATRGDENDFEFPIAHNTMSVRDNQRMQQFMFRARVLPEASFFTEIFRALNVLAGLTQSEVLLSIADFFDTCEHPDAAFLRWDGNRPVDGDAVSEALRNLYVSTAIPGLFEQWWDERIEPLVPAERKLLAREIFRYDQLTRQIYDVDDVPLPRTRVEGVEYYVRQGVEFEFDMEEVLAAVRTGRVPSTERRPTVVDIHLQAGFREHVDSHDVVVGYVGKLAGSRSEPALS